MGNLHAHQLLEMDGDVAGDMEFRIPLSPGVEVEVRFRTLARREERRGRLMLPVHRLRAPTETEVAVTIEELYGWISEGESLVNEKEAAGA